MRYNTASNSSRRKRSSATKKKRYDSALGFVNVANIICDQDLLDKMSTAKLTKVALTKAEKEYKAALQRRRQMNLFLPTKKQTAKVKVQNAKDIINVTNGFDQLTVDETGDGGQEVSPEPKCRRLCRVERMPKVPETEDAAKPSRRCCATGFHGKKKVTQGVSFASMVQGALPTPSLVLLRGISTIIK
ncbi:hypothetical protein CEXT_807301 [Caerostris extrusa]|uniref:Uncharacterized protein n=1 Tax=Caerostris extrusa TaxID=172846 RepID=A0AAV4XLT4_CAEEX|nr:hypothetical protein CEXT_807301 [Caerostris extrusa]